MEKVKYNYSLLRIDYPNRMPKTIEHIRVICSIHGEFKQIYKDHKSGRGCPKCSKNIKLTKEEFIVKSNQMHGNRYDYSKFIYINNYTNGLILCSKHGEFLQSPASHLRGSNCPKCYGHKIWTIEKCIEDALKYKKRTEWFLKSKSAYRMAHRNKWLDECCKHMMLLSKPKNYWTKENSIFAAKKCKTKQEFKKKYSRAYYKAYVDGFIEECCKHMVHPTAWNFKWDLNKCKEDANKYKTRQEWRRNSNSAYNAAHKNKWIEICCKHMVSGYKLRFKN